MTVPESAEASFDPYEMMADLQRRDAATAAVLAEEFPEWSAWTLDDLPDVIRRTSAHPQLRATTAPPVVRAHLTRAAR